MTKAELKFTGDVKWTPPAIYKSSCEINVEWFPFDEQNCDMKFGSWTYDAKQVDLKHMNQQSGNNVVEIGIDLTEFYLSVEWDILDVPATKNVESFNPEMDENEESEEEEKLLTDITFILTMRRKTLFYTVNLIIPCVGISFLTVLVFYLPADSGEKESRGEDIENCQTEHYCRSHSASPSSSPSLSSSSFWPRSFLPPPWPSLCSASTSSSPCSSSPSPSSSQSGSSTFTSGQKTPAFLYKISQFKFRI